MKRLTLIKVACCLACFMFVVLEACINVLPSVEALTPRSFDAPVQITETTFPDVNFRTYIKSHIDSNGDGYLTPKECDIVTKIGTFDEETFEVQDAGLRRKGISDITGIENFPYLESLVISQNSLDTVNLSHNTQLTQLDLRENSKTPGALFSLNIGNSSSEVTVLVSQGSSVTGGTENITVKQVD